MVLLEFTAVYLLTLNKIMAKRNELKFFRNVANQLVKTFYSISTALDFT